MARHGEHGDYHGERKRPKEALPKVFEFWILVRFKRRYLRLQRHTANRTGAWTYLSYLRMHGTCIDDARRCRLERRRQGPVVTAG